MQKYEISNSSDDIDSFVPIKFHQRGTRKIVIPAIEHANEEHDKENTINGPLINALARAFYWSKLIDLGIVASGSEIASREGLEPSTVNERLRLSLISPKIVEFILNGKIPKDLSIQSLTRNSFPKDWSMQEKLFIDFKSI